MGFHLSNLSPKTSFLNYAHKEVSFFIYWCY